LKIDERHCAIDHSRSIDGDHTDFGGLDVMFRW
jgi:hypothetical protein